MVSQAKSFCQWARGDSEGARQTQQKFLKQCPIVSQGTSAVQSILGDNEAALETQKECGGAMLALADGLPVIGHVKGAIHYAAGDQEGGDAAMKAASRTAGVMGGGVAGFCVGGPAGAVGGGIAGGAAMDGITYGADKAISGKDRPTGYVAAVKKVINEPKHKKGGAVFEAAMLPVFDGLAGRGAGQMYESLTQPGQVEISKTGEGLVDNGNQKLAGYRGDAPDIAQAMRENGVDARQLNSVNPTDPGAVALPEEFQGLYMAEEVADARGYGPDAVNQVLVPEDMPIVEIEGGLEPGANPNVQAQIHEVRGQLGNEAIIDGIQDPNNPDLLAHERFIHPDHVDQVQLVENGDFPGEVAAPTHKAHQPIQQPYRGQGVMKVVAGGALVNQKRE